MATKKQKKKRDKERRHEYEYVYVDAEGNEVPVEADEDASGSTNGTSPSSKTVKTSGGRTVDPPSWRKTLRRAGLFAPLIFLILYLLRPKDAELSAVAFNVVVLMAFFIPFSYFMDGLMYRLAVKRGAKTSASAKGSSRK